MCRIAGIVADAEDQLRENLARVTNAMAHGGPDDEGYFIDGAVALGHRRLSIIDLSSAGHQPMASTDQNIIISFNGEIYNYQALKTQLLALGVVFKSNSDTEVIIYAFQQWGTEAFDKLEGIFAFALYVKDQRKLFLVRDHVGVKPLYYATQNDQLIFASEVKAFLAYDSKWPEDDDWKILFLAFGSLPHPYTTLKNVTQLTPGTYLKYDVDAKKASVHTYYKTEKSNKRIADTKEAINVSERAVQLALEKNLIADAPLGIFLSGGIDSSLLTLLADKVKQKVKTISVNFEEATYDEKPFQDLVLEKAAHVDHHSYKVTEQLFWEHLDDIWKAMDQPSADGVNAYFVAKYASKYGLKAVLSGLGADEVFGGYTSFRRIAWMKRLRHLPLKRQIAVATGGLRQPLRRLMFLKLKGPVGDYLFLRGIYTPDLISKLLDVPEKRVWDTLAKVNIDIPEKTENIEYASLLETKVYMTNQLLKDMDYMSMWHGLEVRVPFLDIALLKKVNDIKPSIRYDHNVPKFLLTQAFKNVLPIQIVFRKKYGFTFPFAVWMKRSEPRFKSLMPRGPVADNVSQRFQAGKIHWSKCWSLAVLQNFSNR